MNKKKLLVLGGSYFLGKAFVNMARSEYGITVFNRGNRPYRKQLSICKCWR